MKYVISIIVALACMVSMAWAASEDVTFLFDTDTDEFTDDVTYYPIEYQSMEAYMIAHINLGIPSETTMPVVGVTGGDVVFLLLISLCTDRAVYADTVYIKCDDETFTIDYGFFDIHSSVETAGHAVYVSERYSLTAPLNIDNNILKTIAKAESVMLRVGSIRVIKLDRWELDELKQAIELYFHLDTQHHGH